MSWILYTLLAHVLWGSTNIADKYILENRLKNPYVYAVLSKFLALPILLIIPFAHFYVPAGIDMLWLAVAGGLFFFGAFPYMRAVQIEEITRINIWWGLNPIFALCIEVFVLHKAFSQSEWVGFCVLLTSTILASIHLAKKTFTFSRAVLFMGASTLLYSIYGIVVAHVTKTVPFLVASLWVTIWMAIWAIPFFFARFRQTLREERSRLSVRILVYITLISLAAYIAIIFNQWALSLAPVAFVFSLEGSQMMFVFLAVAVISYFSPGAVKEHYDVKNVVLKIMAMMLMIGGIMILAFA